MKIRTTNTLSAILVFSFLALSACQPIIAPVTTPLPGTPEPTLQAEETTQIPTLPTPTEGITLSEQPYSSLSGGYDIYFPRDWNCSEIGQVQVDCQPPDSTANITIQATATGYELMQTAFESFVNAEEVYTYSAKKAYTEISRGTNEGLLTINATWREGDTLWQSEDIFTRKGAVIYQLSFSALNEQWEQYLAMFDEVNGKIAFHPESLTAAPIYAQTRKYTAPDILFTIDVPTSWAGYVDVASIEAVQLEGFLSPDIHAAVQVAVYRQGSLIKRDAKAIKTLEIMRKLYGSDLRISNDKALPDGRERLTWTAGKRQVNGVSYFNSFGNSMYIFSIVWDNAFETMYKPTLDAVVTSFGHE
jgi:hypothetical protein